MILFIKKTKLKIKLIFIVLIIIIFLYYLKEKNLYNQYDITLVTALFKIKSKFKFINYLNWVKNLLQINTSIVFFIDEKISKKVKKLRPEIYQNKTIWIETNTKKLYSYQNFINNFIKAHLTFLSFFDRILIKYIHIS